MNSKLRSLTLAAMSLSTATLMGCDPSSQQSPNTVHLSNQGTAYAGHSVTLSFEAYCANAQNAAVGTNGGINTPVKKLVSILMDNAPSVKVMP